ncbi:E3 ubiquitin-protein ligase PPP1R11-like [Ornithodoros turicata]|uniref:E3 ubiquitin-protein ligase PPP1R11-like n=1 Tax=Ornithodoros turicata TaxID=34597 RepID=UPI003139D782
MADLRPATTSTSQTQQISAPQEKPLQLTKKSKTKRKPGRKVAWAAGTVDNENMNRKSSKCCCIYVKPTPFGESEEEDDQDECPNCRGHIMYRKDGHLRSPPPEVQQESDALPPAVPGSSGAPGPSKAISSQTGLSKLP